MPTTATSERPADSLLTLQGVSKSYRSPQETTHVLQNLDLQLDRGEITCLLGPSGCGKSTLISLIAGLTVPDSGRLMFDGADVSTLSDSERALLRSTRIGTVLQSGNLVPFLTAAENVALPMRLAGKPSSDALVAELLEQVGLTDRARHLPRRLSGGETQRVALAVSLANSPDLLLADEAVGQLDAATARSVMETFEQTCRERGLAVLLVTHSDEMASMASRTVHLVDGHLEEAS
jgi:putative ABC transport system ATP-binding protein